MVRQPHPAERSPLRMLLAGCAIPMVLTVGVVSCTALATVVGLTELGARLNGLFDSVEREQEGK